MGDPPEPLRLLVIVNVYRPDLGGGVLFSDLCEGLAARGIAVTVRCAYPYYPEWTDKSGRNGLRVHCSEENGVRVERHGLYIPSNPNALGERLVYEASFFLSVLRRLPKRGAFDVVMVYCPLIGAVAYGGVCRWWTGRPLWLNVQDLSADAAAAGGIARGGRVSRLLAGVQQMLFNRADIWTTISPVMVDRLKQLRTRGQPVCYLPHWLHTSLAEKIRALPARDGRRPGSPVRLLYSGNIGTKQDLLRFCQALHGSPVPFRFRIQGEGSRAAEVRDWVATAADDRFSVHDLSDEAGLARALYEADFFVITEKAGIGGSFIPSKLMPGLAVGTPVLAVCDAGSPLGCEMETANPGPRFDWDDLPAVPALLASVGDAPEAYLRWQCNARERAALYDREATIDRYAALVRALASGRVPVDDEPLHVNVYE